MAERSPSLARDEAFVRALHERTDGVPLFVASVMSDVMARAAQGGDDAAAAAQLANVAVPENLAAIIDHYIAKLGNEQRALLSAAAVCGVEFRVSTISDALERDAAWVGQTCDELAREQLWLTAPRAETGKRCGRSCRIRSGTRSSARCCTSARRRRPARSSTAKSAPRWNGSVPRACRSPLRSSPCTSSAAASR